MHLMAIPQQVHLTSTWFIKKGCEEEAFKALSDLASSVYANEPNTLIYFVHRQYPPNPDLISKPPVEPSTVVFFEAYRDAQAFLEHVNGEIFTQFVKQYGNLFIQENNGPFTFVDFLQLQAGFVRQFVVVSDHKVVSDQPHNIAQQHPSIMFEILANNQEALKVFYQTVFGWGYQIGSQGFAYIHFNAPFQNLIGGVGQADNTQPGEAAGHYFYLRVNNLEAYLAKVVEAKGTVWLPPTALDGYRFAMFKDPEGNAVGLLEAH